MLAGVQADSVKVWQSIVTCGEGDVGKAWCKAAIAIEAREDAPWMAKALPLHASEPATAFEFGPPPPQ